MRISTGNFSRKSPISICGAVSQLAAWGREVAKQRQYAHRQAEATPLYQVVSAGRDKLVPESTGSGKQ